MAVRFASNIKYYTDRAMTCGGNIRLNPLGILFLTVVVVVLIYFNTGGGPPEVDNYAKVSGTVSMKSLLAVSIEMAKRGGREVKRIRELVSFIFMLP